jgi:hypothetical protein
MKTVFVMILALAVIVLAVPVDAKPVGLNMTRPRLFSLSGLD